MNIIADKLKNQSISDLLVPILISALVIFFINIITLMVISAGETLFIKAIAVVIVILAWGRIIFVVIKSLPLLPLWIAGFILGNIFYVLLFNVITNAMYNGYLETVEKELYTGLLQGQNAENEIARIQDIRELKEMDKYKQYQTGIKQFLEKTETDVIDKDDSIFIKKTLGNFKNSLMLLESGYVPEDVPEKTKTLKTASKDWDSLLDDPKDLNILNLCELNSCEIILNIYNNNYEAAVAGIIAGFKLVKALNQKDLMIYSGLHSLIYLKTLASVNYFVKNTKTDFSGIEGIISPLANREAITRYLIYTNLRFMEGFRQGEKNVFNNLKKDGLTAKIAGFFVIPVMIPWVDFIIVYNIKELSLRTECFKMYYRNFISCNEELNNLEKKNAWTFEKSLFPRSLDIYASAIRMDAKSRLLLCAIAARKYQNINNAWPKKIKDLFDCGLDKEASIDPFTGAHIKLSTAIGRLTFYSVGQDLNDDNGKDFNNKTKIGDIVLTINE